MSALHRHPQPAQRWVRHLARPLARAALALLAISLTPLAAAQPAQPADALAAATQRLGALHTRPLSDDGVALASAEQAWAQALRAEALKAVKRVGFTPESSDLQLQLDALWRNAQPWSYEGDFSEPMPDALVQALRQRIQQLGNTPAQRPAWHSSAPAPARGTWQTLRANDTDFADTGLFLWSGPAVRDGVTQYAVDGGRTRLRLHLHSLGSLGVWRWLAIARGVPVQLALEDRQQPVPWIGPWPLMMRLRLPVWLASAQSPELIAATLVAVSQSGQCEDNYAEFELTGEPPLSIWAVLSLPDEAVGRAGRVRRIPHPARFLAEDQTSGGATSTRRLELSWPGSAIPSLHLVARRFGEIWGGYSVLASQATAAYDPKRPEPVPRISAAGSPECAPRPITP